ncbi:MAG: RimK/LysX family protein [Porticoccaceae bacterium]|jgi:hypothetical protein|nr:RimK/LysX family protein [Porticoccaceae bacterium]HLS97881.1 RimK/LysX family protein [Porticoccaceae bacterium]
MNRLAALLVATALAATNALANSPNRASEGERVYGWLEKAVVLPVGATVDIKLDSGAWTSSMDAKDIETFRQDGKQWVRFDLRLEDHVSGAVRHREMRLPLERITRVRGAGGEDLRPVVTLPVCIGDRVFHEQFTLRDRENMTYPVLLGRRTMKELGLLDVTATYLNKPACPLARLDRAAGGKGDKPGKGG